MAVSPLVRGPTRSYPSRFISLSGIHSPSTHTNAYSILFPGNRYCRRFARKKANRTHRLPSGSINAGTRRLDHSPPVRLGDSRQRYKMAPWIRLDEQTWSHGHRAGTLTRSKRYSSTTTPPSEWPLQRESTSACSDTLSPKMFSRKHTASPSVPPLAPVSTARPPFTDGSKRSH